MTLLRTAGAPPAPDDSADDLRTAVAALVAAQAQTQAALQQMLQAQAQAPPSRPPTAPPARAGPGRTGVALGLLLLFGVLAVVSQRLLPLDTWLIALVVALPILRVLLALAGFAPPLRGRY